MGPKLSIIVPIYNVEKYIDRCIKSLLSQSLKEIELILIDDESPDNCPSICDKYAQEYNHIKVLHKKNEGLGMACNSGIELATGKYVAFLDSDDWVDDDMYETMFDAAERYKAQVVFTGLRRVDENGNKSPMAQSKILQVYDKPLDLNNFMQGMIASSPNIKEERQVQMSAKVVLYDRTLLQVNNIRFESERKLISEDLFFNLDVLHRATCVVELPMTFYNYYVNSSSLSQTLRTDRFAKSISMREELKTRYGKQPDDFMRRVDRLFIGYSRAAISQICISVKLSLRQKRSLIRDICSHHIWQEINHSYPIKRMPFQHKLFLKCILSKAFTPIYLFCKLK